MGVVMLTSVTAAAPTAGVVNGTLLIMGGAVRPDNAEIWNRLVTAAGGRGAKFAVIAAAAGNPESAAGRIIEALRAHGADGVMVPVAPKLATGDYRVAAQDAANARMVENASGVFFSGGEQSRITDALLTRDGGPTAVLHAVHAVLRRGGVIAGTSAGAAIMSTTMFHEPPDVLTLLKSGIVRGRDIAPGLGFAGPDVFIDQHVLARGRFARMVPAMYAAGYTFGLGVDENTALAVNAAGMAEVIGASGVIVIDTRRSAFVRPGDGVEVAGVRISYLERGDRISLRTRVVEPSRFKLEGRVLNHRAPDFKPEFSEARFYPDVLGKNQLTEILCNLVDNSESVVTGLAFSASNGKGPEQGFEFIFRKGDDTRAHLRIDNAVAHYTVLGVEMDVRRVRMAVPLYRAASSNGVPAPGGTP
jgi:cyanophycinase